MKRLLLIIVGVVIIFAGFNWLLSDRGQTQISNITSAEPTEFAPRVAEPMSLSIPKLGVETTIESVGMDEKGRMDVPSSDATVAWWKLGRMPGERGSAVIAGHYDTPQGTPGVFYEISELVPGDEIIVTDGDDNDYTYQVTDIEAVADATFPLQNVFARDGGYYLNLITCWGVFDKESRNYDKRLVVYAERTKI